MNNDNKENLNDLLNSLYGPEAAAQVEKDLADGYELFAQNPAPDAGEKLKAQIKAQIDTALEARTAPASKAKKTMLLKAISAAAVIVFAAFAAIYFGLYTSTGPEQAYPPVASEKAKPEPAVEASPPALAAANIPPADSFWQDENDNADKSAENTYAALAQSLDSLEQAVIDTRLGTDTASKLDTIESAIENIDINADFWKG